MPDHPGYKKGLRLFYNRSLLEKEGSLDLNLNFE